MIKNYLQLVCGEYNFLLCTEKVAEIVNNTASQMAERTEVHNGTSFYHWNDQAIAVVNLNKRFGIAATISKHQVVFEGSKNRIDSRIMIMVDEVTGIMDVDDEKFQSVQPLAGEFSKLVDAVLTDKDKNWLRIRAEYFY